MHLVQLRSDSQRALLWSFACHPTEFAQVDQVSAEYPGVVRARLRERHGDDSLPVLFVQGFAGDTRPRLLTWWRGQSRSKRIENLLNLGRGFATSTDASWKKWATSLADDVEAVSAAEPDISEPAAVGCERRVLTADELYRGAPTAIELEVSLTRLSDRVHVLGLPGEPTADMLTLLERYHGDGVVIPGGYAGRSLGYLPGPTVIQESGYEAGDFLVRFGLDWSVDPRLCEVLERAVDAVAAAPDRGTPAAG